MSDRGMVHRKHLAENIDRIDEKTNKGGLVFVVHMACWSIAIILIGALFVFGLNWLEGFGR